MGFKAPSVEFALIGHLETWEKISNVLHELRGPEHPPLAMEEVRSIVPWIPPRTITHVRTVSVPSGREVHGVYIDTFITPDELQTRSFKRNIQKVQEAALYAEREGARIAALGGFSSIVIEGDTRQLPRTDVAFTTGNTLTVAYIVKGIEQACDLIGKRLADSQLMVIGSTGDVGSGCVNWFAGKVKQILLCARNERRLAHQCNQLQTKGIRCRSSADPEELLPSADLIISAASAGSAMFSLDSCKPDVLVCDAGYPKNLTVDSDSGEQHVFFGGMGRVRGGFFFDPDLTKAFYEYPRPFIGHGCMLEGMLLALASRYEPFSLGRGFITPEKVEEMWGLAREHGFVLSPFFNGDGLWKNPPLTDT